MCPCLQGFYITLPTLRLDVSALLDFTGNQSLRSRNLSILCKPTPNYCTMFVMYHSSSPRCTRAGCPWSTSEILVNFTNLQKIVVLDMDYFSPVTHPLPQPIHTFLHDMIDTYASSLSLRSLYINALDGVCDPEVLTCPTLTEFHCGDSLLPSITVSCPQITIFEIPSNGLFDLSVLSYLPSLEDLSIRVVKTLSVSSASSGCPSLNLKRLSLLLVWPGAMPTFVGFYNRYARSLSTKAVRALEVLDYEVPFEEDVDALAQILDEAKLL
ncbi:hypothetical protein BJ165DRAFT_1126487 [Panaeolus papilionaceus]|nr:hypothetical protein BJ165DRAFT_1126487 [Panaeolus papilionaceus]